MNDKQYQTMVNANEDTYQFKQRIREVNQEVREHDSSVAKVITHALAKIEDAHHVLLCEFQGPLAKVYLEKRSKPLIN